MGNKLGAKKDPEYLAKYFNTHLGVEPVDFVQANKSLAESSRGPIIFATIEKSDNPVILTSYRILLVHSLGVEFYNVISGDQFPVKYSAQEGRNILAAIKLNNKLLIACKDGFFRAIELETLEAETKFGPGSQRIINCLAAGPGDYFYVGLHSGETEKWKLSDQEMSISYPGGPSSVRCATYGNGYLFVGFEQGYENEYGRYTQLEKNPVVVFSQSEDEQS